MVIRALILSDLDFKTRVFEALNSLVTDFLLEQGFVTETIAIGRNDLAFCRGCFNCWVLCPGQCAIDDKITAINRAYMNAEAVFLLSPVVFGQFSANIKNARDRWIPNILPFFKVREDGSTMHPPRYEEYPKLVIIGYGDAVCEEDRELFLKITKNHLPETAVYFYAGAESKAGLAGALEKTKLTKLRGVF